ncbi:MAG: CoA-binding protein, partial [Deltaproteobacteria bacterium]|nr:CoA-binding protein [Deltaproteobacteria bacterium]
MIDLEKMLEEGSKTLSENDSKQLLSEYGIPVTREKVVATEEDAVAAAAEIGYPVVLKGSGEALAHKTELNLIALDLRDEKDVRAACNRILSTPGGNVEEVLVQQMVKGDREVVVGLTRDPQFGPCVMFGIGGIFTEIMEDVSFRVAPLSRSDAMDMMDQIRGSKILDGIRGKVPINREALADILVAVGEIGVKHEIVSEIDINPLKFIDGTPVAVDALVVLERIENKDAGAIAPVKDFGENFPPESIGIVGVSRTGKTDVPGYTGLQIFRMFKEAGFKGRVYPINPKADKIDGQKCYPDVSSIPEKLDLVIITVSASIVPMVMEDCAKARPRCIQISTSGFSETGLPEDLELEERIKEITLKNKLRVIGPNCIGFHIPSSRIVMHEIITDFNSGPVALLS